MIKKSLLLLLLSINLSTLYADEKPKLELGVGLASLYFPSYTGSKEYQTHLLPLPYVIYRGDALKVNRSGLYSRLFSSDNLQLDLSMNAAVPVSSDDLKIREGMSDLDPVIELGTALKWYMGEDSWANRWLLKLPFRAAVATDLQRFDHVGWRFTPTLNISPTIKYSGWETALNLGFDFADAQYHDYYYGVSAEYANATRPAYEGTAGYGGTHLLASASKRYDNMWVGSFLKYNYLDGASFEDSPLLESEQGWMFGIGFAWIFHQSKEKVDVSNPLDELFD